MAILTRSKLTSFRNTTRYFSKSINESLSEFKSESKYQKVTIFLSHKHNENEELDSAISFLKRFNIEVYVDWQDEGMPQHTSGVTATRIKEKIKSNKKFMLLATSGAINSKWCNWELGLGDAAKYVNHIAILPVKGDFTSYEGSEYLEIYPYIYESDSTPGSYFISYPDGSVKGIENWLRS